MFKKGKIGLKDYGEFFIIHYRIKKRNINQKIYKIENIKEQISGFLIDVYFEYEYDHPLSVREISNLLLLEEASTSKLLNKIFNKIKNNSQKFTS